MFDLRAQTAANKSFTFLFIPKADAYMNAEASSALKSHLLRPSHCLYTTQSIERKTLIDAMPNIAILRLKSNDQKLLLTYNKHLTIVLLTYAFVLQFTFCKKDK